MKFFTPITPRRIINRIIVPTSLSRAYHLTMSSNDQDAPKKSAIPKGKTELKILMLHGYTQSGPLFSSKTKALSKLLLKALSPSPFNLHPTLIYPTAPHRLRPSDIPGYTPPDPGSAEAEEEDEGDNWAWFRKDEATNAYRGFDIGMSSIATAIREAAGIDGILGFSQGGATAALVASALELPYRDPPPVPSPEDPEAITSADWNWLPALREANQNRPLKFCVIYSGFYAPPKSLQWLYEPAISTPTLHFLGSLDTVVEEARSKGLVERCRDPTVIVHPGGHYVPVAKDWVMVLVGWLRQRYQDAGNTSARESL
ncbi:serine hydrolase-domain-containing protein [Hypoxylon trugodes]|uniref:serine hydrolase-domain-containing protein n=1 Tax=Hypoxylon trugodes TaxID=326681 RepID=UPI00218E5B85|nr:serine hydrolase-domain-containing protein [Hypoxylon trugodes]KAI1392481.1 serine hydrolase-domain-containing protein [Hypoxylon trugodes]